MQVIDELPYVLENYRRRKRINEVVLSVKGIACAFLLVTVLSFIYKAAMAAARRRMARDDAARGISFGTAAISKKAARKGRKMDGMGDGWLDMEFEDDDDSKDSDKKPKKDNDKDDD